MKRTEDMIIFEDREILVCHKPAGLAVQNAGIGTMDMESMIKNYLALKQPEKIPYAAVVHRLDQPVEGILVFAKTPKAAKELSAQISGGKMKNYYDRKPDWTSLPGFVSTGGYSMSVSRCGAGGSLCGIRRRKYYGSDAGCIRKESAGYRKPSEVSD